MVTGMNITYVPGAAISATGGTDTLIYQVCNSHCPDQCDTAYVIIEVDPLLGSIGDYVWYDANENGIQDGSETGAQGVYVTLFDGSSNVLATTITDDNGFYQFTDLPAGQYQVGFNIVTLGYGFTTQTTGTTNGSDANATTGLTSVITLAAGENNPNLDAGIIVLPGSIGDYVWNDENSNGIQDASEEGVEGVLVTLYDADGNVLGTTTTDTNGFYGFTDLSAGVYQVGFSNLPLGYTFTTQTTGTSNGSDADQTTGLTPLISLAPGENNTSQDAGVIAPAPCEPFVGEYCTEPMTPITICPEFCIPGDYDITYMHSLFTGCSLTNLGDTCIKYMPLPLFSGTETVIIVACSTTFPTLCDTATLYITVGDCNPNDPPVAVDDYAMSDGGTPVTIFPLTNDSDPDGDPITITTYTQPTNGTVIFDGTTFIYTPNQNFEGVDLLIYQICDPYGECDLATIYITVTNNICEEQGYICAEPMVPIILTPNFCDLNGQEWTITDATTTFNCSIQYIDEQTIQYTALPLFAGEEVLTVIACTAAGVCDTVEIIINVTNDCELGGRIAPRTPTELAVIAAQLQEFFRTGVEPSVAITMSASPIPTRDVVTLTFSSAITEATELNVYDLTGRLLHSQPVVAGTQAVQVDASHYAVGIYMATVRTANGTTATRFVTQR